MVSACWSYTIPFCFFSANLSYPALFSRAPCIKRDSYYLMPCNLMETFERFMELTEEITGLVTQKDL